MKYNVLIISSIYLSQYMEDILKKYTDKIDYRIEIYHSFSDVPDIFTRNQKWADGVLTTGVVVQTVLERSILGISKPVLSLATDNESFYRIPLSLLIENRTLEPERIVFDVFAITKPVGTVRDFVEYKNINMMFPEFRRWLANASLEDLYHIEETTLTIIKELWEEKKIDMVICRYGNMVSKLKELQVPCIFANSSDEYVHQSIQLLMSKIQVDKLTAHSPAVIAVTPVESGKEIWDEYYETSLKKVLLDFAKRNDMDFLIQKKQDTFLILSEKMAISFLTENFQNSPISLFLEKNFHSPVIVSYGIGNTMEDAIDHAQIALRSSENSQAVYLVDAERRLIGPLGMEEPVITSNIFTPHIQAIAEQAALSTATIHRINRMMLLLEKREITSTELAENFNITMRGANRILKRLEMAGLATSSLKKSEHVRGRPTKIYRIEWEAI